MTPQQLDSAASLLVKANLIDRDLAFKIQQEATTAKIPFVTQLVKNKAASASQAAQILADATSSPYFDITALNTNLLNSAQPLIKKEIIQETRCLPLWMRGQNLVVAMSDPTNQTHLRNLKFSASASGVNVVVVDDDKLNIVIDKFLAGTETSLSALAGEEDIDFKVQSDDDDEPKEQVEELSDEAENSPVVKFVNKMLKDAIALGASDLHFEPYEKFYRVRYRVDGVLKEVARPPRGYVEKIAARIKVMSRVDVSEKRIPQDGRTKLRVSEDRVIDFRVSTCPMLHGEKIVMRILDPSSATLGIDALGYDPDQKENLMSAVQRPYGMVLVTGPTGSGKTVSLYTCLNIINTEGTNISTAEDPAEINLPGINQVNVNDKVGLTFAAALKSFLRQDPDVIMIGEIRDIDTAEIAIKAAQTGHLVLSTLHTNDAPTTITRLANMGVKPFNIASSVILVTAQRLARRLCTCKIPVSIPDIRLKEAGFTDEDLKEKFQLYGPREGGCERCRGAGYKGRVGIYQVMPITDEIRRIILKDANAMDIEAQSIKEGVKTLRMSGVIKVKQGFTSLEEIEAVTNA